MVLFRDSVISTQRERMSLEIFLWLELCVYENIMLLNMRIRFIGIVVTEKDVFIIVTK
jgi:hypothetical protein